MGCHGMFIIGQWSSKSTFGANKKNAFEKDLLPLKCPWISKIVSFAPPDLCDQGRKVLYSQEDCDVLFPVLGSLLIHHHHSSHHQHHHHRWPPSSSFAPPPSRWKALVTGATLMHMVVICHLIIIEILSTKLIPHIIYEKSGRCEIVMCDKKDEPVLSWTGYNPSLY